MQQNPAVNNPTFTILLIQSEIAKQAHDDRLIKSRNQNLIILRGKRSKLNTLLSIIDRKIDGKITKHIGDQNTSTNLT